MGLLRGKNTPIYLKTLGWTPRRLSNLGCWLLATKGTTLRTVGIDNFVTDWADQSGNGNNFSQITTTQQPLLINDTDGLAVTFDGQDDRMIASSSTDFGLANGLGIWIVFKSTVNRTAQTLFSKTGEWFVSLRRVTTQSFFTRDQANTMYYQVDDGLTWNGVIHLIQAIYDPIAHTITIKKDSEATNTTAAPDNIALTAGGLTLGPIADWSPYRDTFIYELITTSTTPSDKDITLIRKYLNQRHGIAI
jgi:hypothetical protein